MAGLIRPRAVLWRLLGLQASWSYERMQGTGVGWAIEPELRARFGADSPRYREALARAAMFFNANPFLAAAAVGAEARAEVDEVPGPQVERLRTALCGPLGALGDRLFWAGVVPGLGAAAIIAVTFGAGVWAALGVVLLHNALRLLLGRWLLGLGWAHGLRIGGAISATSIPRSADRAVAAAAVLCTAAVPIAARWLVPGGVGQEVVVVAAFMAAALLLRALLGPRGSARRLTLLGAAVVLVWHWINP